MQPLFAVLFSAICYTLSTLLRYPIANTSGSAESAELMLYKINPLHHGPSRAGPLLRRLWMDEAFIHIFSPDYVYRARVPCPSKPMPASQRIKTVKTVVHPFVTNRAFIGKVVSACMCYQLDRTTGCCSTGVLSGYQALWRQIVQGTPTPSDLPVNPVCLEHSGFSFYGTLHSARYTLPSCYRRFFLLCNQISGYLN